MFQFQVVHEAKVGGSSGLQRDADVDILDKQALCTAASAAIVYELRPS